MTAFQTYALICDACGAQFHTDPPYRLAGDVRAIAAWRGWTNITDPLPAHQGPNPTRDYCGVCQERTAPAPEAPFPRQLPPELAEYVATVLRSLLHNKELKHPGLADRAATLLEERKRP